MLPCANKYMIAHQLIQLYSVNSSSWFIEQLLSPVSTTRVDGLMETRARQHGPC